MKVDRTSRGMVAMPLRSTLRKIVPQPIGIDWRMPEQPQEMCRFCRRIFAITMIKLTKSINVAPKTILVGGKNHRNPRTISIGGVPQITQCVMIVDLIS